MDPTHLKKSEWTLTGHSSVQLLTAFKKAIMLLNLKKLLYTLAIVEEIDFWLIKKENKKLYEPF